MDDALERMKQVIRWYLSGFYKKPKVEKLLFLVLFLVYSSVCL